MPALRSARATSAGGVVFRSIGPEPDVVIVHRRRPLLWALPKGTPNAGETFEETALRETREETGLEVVIEAPISSIRYVFIRGSTRFNKTVHFFLMRPIGGGLELHDAEFDEVRWASGSEALALLTHETERSVLEEALTMIPTLGSTEATR